MPYSRKFLTGGITAFLDLLGFSERILEADTNQDFEAIISDIEVIQRAFEFKVKDKRIRETHTFWKKTVLALSDSVIVNLPLQSQLAKLQGTLDTVMAELSGMALAQAQCVASGLFLRGGVDIGWWYRQSSTLASESLVRAYRAERVAVVPVIRLSDELYEWLVRHPHRNYYSEDIEPVKTMLREYKGVGPDGDAVSFRYIDYLSVWVESLSWETSPAQRKRCMAAPPAERESIREKGYQTNILRWLKHHARMIKQGHTRAASVRVKSKYEWLAEYHNEIAPRYTNSRAALCSLRQSIKERN